MLPTCQRPVHSRGATPPAPAGAVRRLAYGPESLRQFGELRLPPGAGPFPVVVALHGGCWLATYDLQTMTPVCEALTRAGYATWNLEYRRLGQRGGGWPGTFQDVARGFDFLPELARRYPILPRRVLVLGHSAGGQLALWLAARAGLPPSSPLYTPAPLVPAGVVALAGIPDLADYAVAPGGCNEAVAELLGGLPAAVPERYAQASPAQRLPLRVPYCLVQGTADRIVPPEQAQAFGRLARQAGDAVRVVEVPGADHFDLIAPGSPAWPAVMQAVGALLPLPGHHP
ncbi:alpha/beta hydrolase [Hymenobacter persicinus]|uniref:Alpha/beta hydrolase n=1 Tax=Hymenobacter persicinus TaxID=2025506 RepID=A0A4V1ZAQ1_9BACT|nr:alpha/beta hydrolase [Hymenobacter persicinus]